MPKEVIFEPSRNGYEPRFAVHVGWTKDHDMEIATFDSMIDPGSVERGWFINLGRSQINDLIRALRRARDQAFGADE